MARHLQQGNAEPPHLATHLLVQACQQLGVRYQGTTLACRTSRPLRRFTWVDRTARSWLPTALLLAVAASAYAPAASPRAEASLSRGLHTPPLPATHAAVGNPWQNRGLCRSTTAQQSRQRPRVAPACRSAVFAPNRAPTPFVFPKAHGLPSLPSGSLRLAPEQRLFRVLRGQGDDGI